MKHNTTQVVTRAVVREETQYPDGKVSRTSLHCNDIQIFKFFRVSFFSFDDLILQVEQLLSDGSRVIVFRNGTRKEIGADQKSITVMFYNGDVKRILADGTMVCETQMHIIESFAHLRVCESE